MYSKYLDSQLQSRGIPIRVNSVHPGVVHTDLYTHVGWVGYVFRCGFLWVKILTSENVINFFICYEMSQYRYYK
jgi:hypothetical protein